LHQKDVANQKAHLKDLKVSLIDKSAALSAKIEKLSN